MAAFEMLPDRAFDPGAFGTFLSAQPDLGTKWPPAFVRVTGALPQTASGKVTKDPLRSQGWWQGGNPLFCRDGSTFDYVPLDDARRDALREEFRCHGRGGLIGG
jgi:fatty-acyl-CoA synthase